MAAELLLERAIWLASVLLLVVGALGAWASANMMKRVAGVLLAFVGAALGLAALDAAQAAAAALAAAFAYLTVGVALVVRVQEAYGAVEARELDAADAADEPERGA